MLCWGGRPFERLFLTCRFIYELAVGVSMLRLGEALVAHDLFASFLGTCGGRVFTLNRRGEASCSHVMQGTSNL